MADVAHANWLLQGVDTCQGLVPTSSIRYKRSMVYTTLMRSLNLLILKERETSFGCSLKSFQSAQASHPNSIPKELVLSEL